MSERKGRGHRNGGNARAGRSKREKKTYPEYVGRVQMTREGYIFVIVENEEDDVFVKASRTGGALHGDTVRVAVTREKTDRKERCWRLSRGLKNRLSEYCMSL